MFEELIKINTINKRHGFALVLGFIYVLIAAGTAYLLFNDFMALAMLFLTTILLLPTLAAYLSRQERIESVEGAHAFVYNHRDIIETYLFLFIGVFIGYLVVATIGGSHALAYQFTFLERQGVNEALVQQVPESNVYSFLAILSKNLLVDAIAFLFSVFYGAGAIFLVVFNASIFTSFIVKLKEFIAASPLAVFAAFSIHLIPELSGFLLAAIAGGVLSKAFTTEKIGSEPFRNVVQDSMWLFLISVGLIAIGAFLEIYVTRGAFRMILG